MNQKLTLYCDGASRGNPGPGSFGYVIVDDASNEVLEERGEVLGTVTNNVAEYEGLIQGLARCHALGASSVTIKSDSQLLVRQLNGQYKVKAAHLHGLVQKARSLLDRFTHTEILHIPREQNKHADRLANAALDGATP